MTDDRRLICNEVEDQIELFAAGECDASLWPAVAAHLESCLVCARAHAEARRGIGLLELEA
ncbi:MAG TPA: hypothetical protein PKE47_07140, partial [Verrucomicrobiota bacterium]|nr:hypothetical protein [Verrucomicrobiota bacterium]